MKKWNIFYIILFFAICLVPSLGMLVTDPEVSAENRELASFPSLRTEEGWNSQWLPQAGDYFQEHFAFRNELVTANALLNGKILGVSTTEGVIQGTDNWLYYKDSLEDYQGTSLLSDRSLFNIAHSLSMMQEYLEGKGVIFLFTVAPNKNSLYGEHMPYYYQQKVTEENNLARLKPVLEEEGVAYTDLYRTLKDQKEILYHERDSHWNNKGAALAADTLLTALEKEHMPYEEETYEEKVDFEGDLDKMLYPLAMTPETEIYYDRQTTYAYVGEVESNFDPRITTVNPVKTGSLVMYRDSFGNAILPFMADAYANAYFSRGVPYQLMDVEVNAADTVVVERAERFLPDMAQNPPVMEAPLVTLTQKAEETAMDGAKEVQMKTLGPNVQISGLVKDEYLENRSRIYLRINGKAVYEAFPRDVERGEEICEQGFFLQLPAEKLIPGAERNTVEVLTETDGICHVIYKNTLKEEMTQ